MKITTLLSLFSLFALVSCRPSQQSVETAIAQTQIVIGLTEASRPTATPQATDTPIPSATPTATLTPSPTLDLQVIDIDPRRLLLQKDNLPPNGRYYLPNEQWMSPLTNSEIVSSWTVEEGQAYLAETGRIHGWEVIYNRGTNNVTMPQEVYHNVVLYSNIEGAQIVINKYSARNIENGYKEIDFPQIGDMSHAYQKSETDTNGGTRAVFRLEFVYRNLYHAVVLWGWENEVSSDFAVGIANKLLENSKQLPLSDMVTFNP